MFGHMKTNKNGLNICEYTSLYQNIFNYFEFVSISKYIFLELNISKPRTMNPNISQYNSILVSKYFNDEKMSNYV